MKTVVALAGLCLFLGCASHPSPNLSRSEVAQRDWTQSIGHYTYEQAIADLGQPAALGESSSGRWAEWVLRRSPQLSYGFGVGSGRYGPGGAVGVGVGSTVTQPPSGQYLRLEFGPDHQLKEWRKVRY